MNLGSILKGNDNINVTRMVDRLSVDPAKKVYLESIDSFINLSRSIFCRRKTVDQHIEYFEQKHSQNMRDTHYVIYPKQIEKLMGGMMDTLKNEQLLNKTKELNKDIEAKMDKMGKMTKERNAMIDAHCAEYEELKQNLTNEYQIKCEEMRVEMDQKINEIKEKYKNMNECVSSLTLEQLESSNPFKAAFYKKQSENNDTKSP